MTSVISASRISVRYCHDSRRAKTCPHASAAVDKGSLRHVSHVFAKTPRSGKCCCEVSLSYFAAAGTAAGAAASAASVSGCAAAKPCAKAVLADVLAVFVHADGQERNDHDRDAEIAAVTIAVLDDVREAGHGDGHGQNDDERGHDGAAHRRGLDAAEHRQLLKAATKPKIVVTPVEMRQSMRQTP